MGVETLEELIKRAGGCAVIDGGFATELEALGADINDPIWSALCLMSSPHLIKQVHMQYLEAGADILITSSYKATIPGFLSKGLSVEEAEQLIQKSVKLAIEARDEFRKLSTESDNSLGLVAASIGSYAAYLPEGSEYRGYGNDVTLEKLKDFHRRRLQILASAGPDLLAFETIPNKLEIQAIVQLLDEENIQIPSWICLSTVDGKHLPSGETFKECLEITNRSEKVTIVGVNCAPPEFIEDIVKEFKKLTKKPIAVYPNNGEIWDPKARIWLLPKCVGKESFEELARKWHEAGATLIGGCCKTTPSTIRAVSKILKKRS